METVPTLHARNSVRIRRRGKGVNSRVDFLIRFHGLEPFPGPRAAADVCEPARVVSISALARPLVQTLILGQLSVAQLDDR